MDIEKRIKEIEGVMSDPHFWEDKDAAQALLQELQECKKKLGAQKQYDSGSAIITIFAGAGGDDAEDFVRMLFEMYQGFATRRNFSLHVLHAHHNTQKGFRNITFEIAGKNAYGILKGESGVHRLVRLSPFNAKSQRHTSFAMVEVVPQVPKQGVVVLREEDLVVEFSKSGGPGGQNVNKRETAVRIVHTPSNISVSVDSERSQAQNKEKALDILRGKLYQRAEKEQQEAHAGHAVSKTVANEWGSQMRSYVLHPYKLIKDHARGVESSDVDGILGGALDIFLDA